MITGHAPLWSILREAEKREIVVDFPLTPLYVGRYIDVRENASWQEILGLIELQMNWTYDPTSKTFVPAGSTHSVDGPDAAGRPTAEVLLSKRSRPVVALGVLFVKVNGSATLDDVSGFAIQGGAQRIEFWASAIEGQELSWGNTTERTYITGVTSAEKPGNAPSTPTVQTGIGSRSAGLQVHGIAARLPGNMCRIDGDLSISAFTGEGLGTSSIQVPLEIDAPRGKWNLINKINTLDVSARLALKQIGFGVKGGSDQVLVFVRVD